MDRMILTIDLVPGAAHVLPLAAPWKARVLEGSVWFTWPGSGDLLAMRGEEIPGRRHMVFEALTGVARLEVEVCTRLCALPEPSGLGTPWDQSRARTWVQPPHSTSRPSWRASLRRLLGVP